jgi:hypothetical protein
MARSVGCSSWLKSEPIHLGSKELRKLHLIYRPLSLSGVVMAIRAMKTAASVLAVRNG